MVYFIYFLCPYTNNLMLTPCQAYRNSADIIIKLQKIPLSHGDEQYVKKNT